ncbi:mini-chromosome maintenance complex-binding protein [Nilaparvata lugens]|uniref:mini-chromosome maintenance complex-binding protein n=1 Tax=Nilaparvata lugens TaxID=108931 RepID=UPI00193C8F0C|nr:mini-chromosome maintenance complex-binding protein [Nilaparvata lugens]
MQCRKDFIGKIDQCKDIIKDEEVWNKIPVVNYTPNNLLFHDQLVIYRGMVQDMLNPVLYLSQYEVKNIDTGESSVRQGQFTDALDCKDNEEAILESSATVYKERSSIYCVTVPGSNNWVEKSIRERNSANIANLQSSSACEPASSPSASENKRTLNDDEKMEEDCNESELGNTSNKRICTGKVPDVKQKAEEKKCVYNLPISERSKEILHPAVLINVYDEDLKLQINDVIEVAGFLSCDPTVINGVAESVDEDFPPASLVPRINAVHVRVLPASHNQSLQSDVLRCAETTRAELHSILSKVLLGDNLAADYLLLHLLSTVFQRKDALVLGKCCLNLSNLPKGSQYSKLLYNFLTNLVPTSHYEPMSLESLNSSKFVPKKNYETSRLESGILQMSKNTLLVLDETKMQAGQLNDRGVRNVQALTGLINFQKVDYDFQYYPVEFPMDIRVLVLSEGKSMLPSDFDVCLDYADTTPEYIEELFVEAGRFVERQSLTDTLRAYLTTVANLAYQFSDDVETKITEDFVKMRRERQKTSSQDLHNLLVLARLFSLSRGCTTLSKETWEIVQDMEEQRRLRMEK